MLARKRLEVLQLLARHAGTIVRKEEIINSVWPDQNIDENNLTLQIFNLRRDIEDDPKNPIYILTAPGIGYLLRTDPVAPLPVIEPVIESDTQAGNRSDGTDRHTTRFWFRSKLFILSFATFFLAIGLFIGYAIWRNSRPHKPTITQYTSLSGLESGPAFSPDGRMLVFSSEGDDGNNQDLYLKKSDNDEPIRLTDNPDNDSQACWSPDGTQIAFIRENALNGKNSRLILLTSLERLSGAAEEREIAEVHGGLDWSPDGKYFVIEELVNDSGSSGLSLLSVDGREKIVLTTPSPGEVTEDVNPRFSPDGRKIAFLRNPDKETALTDLFLVDLDRKGQAGTVQLTFDRRRITDLQWMPDGRSIIIASDRDDQRRLWLVPTDHSPPRIVTTIEDKFQNFALTRDGKRLAYTERLHDTRIEIRTLGQNVGQPIGQNGKYPCQINSSSTEDSPRFSPNGSRLALISGRNGKKDLWIANSDCTGLEIFKTFPNTNGPGSPRWSPDGSRIAFDQLNDGLVNVYLLDLAAIAEPGSRLPRGLTIKNHSNIMPAWSHDGRRIYFESSRDGRPQIWRQDIETGEQFQVTRSGGSEPVESPDGRSLFYTKDSYIWRRDQQTGIEEQVRELENFQVGRYWDLGSRSIYFVPRTSDVRSFIHRFDLLTRRIDKVMEVGGFPTRSVPGLSVTPDEKLLAISYISYRMGDIKLAEGWIKF